MLAYWPYWVLPSVKPLPEEMSIVIVRGSTNQDRFEINVSNVFNVRARHFSVEEGGFLCLVR